MAEQGMGNGIEPSGHGARLAFDAWAGLSARLLDLDQEARLDLLDDASVDPDEWAQCEQHYALAIADDIAHGRMGRAQEYAKACAAEMARRKTAGDPAAPGHGIADEPTHIRMEDGAAMKHGAPLHAPPADVPSFLHARDRAPAEPIPAQDGATTAAVFALPSALRGGALPFREGVPPSISATSTAPLPATSAAGAGDTQVLGGTVPLDPAAVLQAALPFGGAQAPKRPLVPPMPLPTYAALCAELAAFPDRAAETRTRYGITGDEAHAALDKLWRGRFEASPDVRAEWQALVAKQQAELLRGRR